MVSVTDLAGRFPAGEATGAAAADATAAAAVASPVGWGVIGCGWVARDYALPAIRAAARLVAVYDADPDAACGHACRSADSLAELLADPAIEAVYVATPNHAHREAAVAAAGAGKAVLCEKPIAATADDADAIVAACRAARVPYATAFDQRFHGAHRMLRDLVAAGELGTLVEARIRYACWLPSDWRSDNWRIDRARAGGGAVIDLAPHGIDLIATIAGVDPVDIHVLLQRRLHDYATRGGVDDGGIVSVRFAGDLLASISVGYNCPDALPRRRLDLTGTRGAAFAVNTMGQTAGGTLTLIDKAGSARRLEIKDDRPPFEVQIEAFSAHVRRERRPEASRERHPPPTRPAMGPECYPGSPERDLHTFHLLDRALAAAERNMAGRRPDAKETATWR